MSANVFIARAENSPDGLDYKPISAGARPFVVNAVRHVPDTLTLMGTTP